MKSLTDNWLIQVAAEFLDGSVDPLRPATWIRNDDSKKSVVAEPTTIGALQVLSLVALLEQIVMCDEINVLEGWTSAWRGKVPSLDGLQDCGFIKEIGATDGDLRTVQEQYAAQLCVKDYVRTAFMRAAEQFAAGTPAFDGQVLNGSVPYLALSDYHKLAYCPHPVRDRYLQNELYLNGWSQSVLQKYETLHQGPRVSLVKKQTNDRSVLTVASRMSSIGLFCIMNAGGRANAIKTAYTLRNDREFQNLRASLFELRQAIDSRDAAQATALSRTLELAVADASKRLRIIPLGEEDGHSTINIFDLPVKIPDWLRRPISRPKHSSISYRLLAVHCARTLEQVLAQDYGIKSKQVVRDMARLYES